MNDKLNRKIYAKEIAEEISDKYNSEKELTRKDPKHKRENIVFAISGKWGEGKTGILDLMEKPLEAKGFKIIRFNPWKYSQEDITLKRAFLKTVRDYIKPGFNLDDLYYDKTKTNITWGNLKKNSRLFKWFKSSNFILFFIIIIFLLLVDSPIFYFTSTIFTLFKSIIYSPLVTVLLTLLIIPVILKAITSERKSAAVATAEEFEDKFDDLLKKSKKIVIFIDDLDRCAPKTIKLILDSLKTFFLHPECSYVITGDHTIIERYAGEELELNRSEYTSDKRLAEGRRFLKKLFDVYWRVPLPTPFQFKNFVKANVEESKIDFPNDTNLNNFVNLLTNDDFFERNLRQARRFITKLRFALQSVKLQIEEIEQEFKSGEKDGLTESKKSLEEILSNPDLLAKVLLIEEHFYPLYAWLVIHPEELIEQEKAIRGRKDVNENIFDDKTQNLLGKDNTSLYDILVSSSPKFTNEENSVVHEVADYFLFSGSTGLPSALGPDESKFVEYIKAGQLTEKLGKILEVGTTKDKNEVFAEKAIEIFDEPVAAETPKVDSNTQITEKLNIVSESLKLAAKLGDWAEKLEEWKERVYKLPAESQSEVTKLLFEALLNKKPEIISEVQDEHPELLSLLWDIIPTSDKTNWSDKANGILSELAKGLIKPDSPDLKSAESYLSANLPNELQGELEKILIDPNICKTYLEDLKSLGILDGNIAAIVKNNLSNLLKDINQIDWIVENIEYLKELKLLPSIQSKLVASYKQTEDLGKLITASDKLEFSIEIKKDLEKELLNKIKSKDISLIKNSEIFTINKGTKLEIFKLLTQFATSSKSSYDQKKGYCKILSKGNDFWKDMELTDVQTDLDIIKKIFEKRNQKLATEYKATLTSWNYT